MLSIGEVIVFGKSFDSVMTILKATPRPVSMLFTKSPDAQVRHFISLCEACFIFLHLLVCLF